LEGVLAHLANDRRPQRSRNQKMEREPISRHQPHQRHCDLLAFSETRIVSIRSSMGGRAAKVTIAVERLRHGNFSNVKGVGAGVQEFRINWGPGYRLYLGRDGEKLVILLTGGTKQRQDADIEQAKTYWADYKRRRV
jgi:putative addiction module killer protein